MGTDEQTKPERKKEGERQRQRTNIQTETDRDRERMKTGQAIREKNSRKQRSGRDVTLSDGWYKRMESGAEEFHISRQPIRVICRKQTSCLVTLLFRFCHTHCSVDRFWWCDRSVQDKQSWGWHHPGWRHSSVQNKLPSGWRYLRRCHRSVSGIVWGDVIGLYGIHFMAIISGNGIVLYRTNSQPLRQRHRSVKDK